MDIRIPSMSAGLFPEAGAVSCVLDGQIVVLQPLFRMLRAVVSVEPQRIAVEINCENHTKAERGCSEVAMRYLSVVLLFSSSVTLY